MTKLDAFMAACAAIAAMLLANPDANAQGIERDSTHGIIRPSAKHAPPNMCADGMLVDHVRPAYVTACVTGHGGAGAPPVDDDSDDDGGGDSDGGGDE